MSLASFLFDLKNGMATATIKKDDVQGEEGKDKEMMDEFAKNSPKIPGSPDSDSSRASSSSES